MKFKMGKVPILDTINKIPGGLMVVPLVLGVLVNTFFPNILRSVASPRRCSRMALTA